jgi:nitroimidazol reductase NimA-like FMN-containing flavoprotein (pyridoxamine 5'-phosphate oxidase superfamily)
MIEPERTRAGAPHGGHEVDDSEVGGRPEDEPDEETDRISVLSEAECLQLLGEHDLGRVAIVLDGQPEIFPVNYAVGADVIAFRTAPGTKLAHAPMTRVAFEVDGVDRVHGFAWSVVVKGVASEITHALGRMPEAVRHLAVEPMAPGQRTHWLTVQRQQMTGRRFPITPF